MLFQTALFFRLSTGTVGCFHVCLRGTLRNADTKDQLQSRNHVISRLACSKALILAKSERFVLDCALFQFTQLILLKDTLWGVMYWIIHRTSPIQDAKTESPSGICLPWTRSNPKPPMAFLCVDNGDCCATVNETNLSRPQE
jgi:hypothetical protein